MWKGASVFMMKYFLILTGNRMLMAALVAWFLAQLIKTMLGLIINRKFDANRLVGAGGMPSSHTSFVVALATSIGRLEGLASPAFSVAACFAIVVMYDAAGVRRAAGEQAKIINYMMDHWNETTPETFQKELKELLGHTPVEVIAGALLGLLVGFLAST